MSPTGPASQVEEARERVMHLWVRSPVHPPQDTTWLSAVTKVVWSFLIEGSGGTAHWWPWSSADDRIVPCDPVDPPVSRGQVSSGKGGKVGYPYLKTLKFARFFVPVLLLLTIFADDSVLGYICPCSSHFYLPRRSIGDNVGRSVGFSRLHR